MNKKLLMSFVFVLAFVFNIAAQDRTVSGKVTASEDGTALPGVNVSIKGTSRGTTTSAQGTYKISVPEKATLVFSFVGFSSQNVAVGSRTEVNVSLISNVEELSEVVVTALGIEKNKRELNYATQTVKGSDIAQKAEPNVLNALQGKIAGVQIVGASGEAGASTNINIRGINSFTGSNQPLFIVDGIPVSNDLDRTNGGPNGTLGGPQSSNRALDIAPENIESIDVLKGPAAASLYGSRAASGAIIITTKAGKGGNFNKKLEVTINSSYTVQNVYGYPELQNDYGQGSTTIFNPTSANSWGPKFGTLPTIANGLLLPDGSTRKNPDGSDYAYQAYPNNVNGFFKQGTIATNSVNLQGGNATQSYSLLIANTGQKGIIPGSEFNRTNISFGGNTTLLNKIKFGGTFNYTLTNQNNFLTGNNSSAPAVLSTLPRSYDLQGLPYTTATGRSNYIVSTTDNPYWSIENNKTISSLDRLTGSINLEYAITPWVTATYRLGLDQYTDRRKQTFAIGAARLPTGAVYEDVFYRSEINSDLILRFKKDKIFGDNINFTGLLGYNVNQRKFQNVSAYGGGLTLPNYFNVNNATTYTSSNGATGESNTLRRLIGYYGQASFDYKKFIFLEATGRLDQSSTLPKANNTFFYYSGSVGLDITEAFNIKSDILSFGKVRVNYAKVGKDADPYLLNSVYTVTSQGNNVSSITFPINGQAGFSIGTRIGSGDNLTPEFTSAYEVGANLGMFKNRLNLDIAAYSSKSTDQIINVAVAASTGYLTRTTNIGQLSNKGIEVMLSYKIFNTKDFNWTLTANYSLNRNNVDAIGAGVTAFNIPGNSFTGTAPSIVEGRPYGVILGNKRARTPDGTKFIVNPQTGLWVAAIPNQEIANPNPDAIIGVTNTFSYKGVGLSFLFDSQQGGQIISFTLASLKASGALKETAVDREKPRIIDGVFLNADGTYTPNNIQIDAQNYFNQGLQTDLNVYGATVYRLREASLSYSLPKSIIAKTPFGGVSLSFTGRNLFYFAPNSLIDPELSTQGAGNIRGLELQSSPNTRNYGVNLRLSF